MRTIARLLGIAVMVTAAALGTAGPSSAEQTMEGYYIFNALASRRRSGRSTRSASPPSAMPSRRAIVLMSPPQAIPRSITVPSTGIKDRASSGNAGRWGLRSSRLPP